MRYVVCGRVCNCNCCTIQMTLVIANFRVESMGITRYTVVSQVSAHGCLNIIDRDFSLHGHLPGI